MRMGTSRQVWYRSVLRMVLAFGLAVVLPGALAQTGGEGGLQGTVTDTTGAAVSDVTVRITNDATGVTQTKTSTGAGVYSFAPIPPGTYTVTAKHEGFQEFVQKNLKVDAVNMTALDVKMTAGATTEVVEVTAAPPQLQTENASLGLTIENDAYSSLPLVLNGAQRDATAVGTLAPGAQGGSRLPVVGGTGNYLGQLYLDGLPAQTVSQQGDNRLVSLAVSVDAIDQLQVLTSTPPVEYSGAGAENFTMKSGGLKYHGQVSDFIRNTAFDTWPFLTKSQQVPDGKGGTVPASKPVDHQNELSASVGGHVPLTKRVFFFVAYDRYHQRKVNGPASYTVPTTLERAGDFTELNGNVGSGGFTGVAGDPSAGGKNPALLFDPTTTTCASGTCTRKPFMGLKNGIPTYNVIPANYISPIAQAMQSFMPQPTNPGSLVNNFAGSVPGGFDNYSVDYRVDFQVTPNHRISTVGALGKVQYLNNFSAPFLPLPYTGGDYAVIYPKVFDVQDVYSIGNNLVNQLKFGFTRFYQDITDATQGVKGFQIGDLGVTNLPAGQAGQEFPGVSFATAGASAVAMQTWTLNSNAQSTQVTTPNNFTLLDNLLWTRGRHSITAGIQVQWQEINNANPATYTGILSLPFNAFPTAQFTGSGLNTTTGYSYASFLLGAVGNSATGPPSLGLQPVSEVGGRYRPIAPYVSDNWKVTGHLTIDAGLRWDYLPPYHEVKDRWSFLNPNVTNPLTGTQGAIQLAGNYGGAGVSCNCRTPVRTYWGNWGPRVGLTYQVDDKTVFRIGAGRVFSQGGGVGGRGGAFNGTGQLGFNATALGASEVTTGSSAGPSFYLNNSPAFTALGLANTSLFGPGYTYPSPPAFSAATQGLDTGFYLSGGKNVTAGGTNFADPYFSGRAPNFTFYNAGFQRAFTNAMTVSINYVGNQSHHLINSTSSGANARGYWSNQLDPRYLVALGPLTGTSLSGGTVALLDAPATAANVAKVAQALGGSTNIPAFFQADAAVNGAATIAQGLVAFPQYSSVTDTWGANVGNFSYNSLQITIEQRLAHGLTFNFNYTWSKNIGDDGTFRSGFAIPAAAISRSSGQSWAMDRIERAVTTIAAPHIFHAYGVYSLPFGKGRLGGQNAVARQLVGGWQLSGLTSYSSGTPAAIIASNCSTGAGGNLPLQGQCMPDLNPVFGGQARQGGGFGKNADGSRTTCALGVAPKGVTCPSSKPVQYFNQQAFQNASAFSSGTLLLGNAPRTRAYGLVNPAQFTFDASVRRTFQIYESVNFVFEADAVNVLNHTLFANPNATFGSSAFGTITSTLSSYQPRGFQFAGHLNF